MEHGERDGMFQDQIDRDLRNDCSRNLGFLHCPPSDNGHGDGEEPHEGYTPSSISSEDETIGEDQRDSEYEDDIGGEMCQACQKLHR